MTNKEWKVIPGYENLYEVSNHGKIARIDKGFRLLRQRLNGRGYPQVNLSKEGVLYTVAVHRLVAEAFVPNPNHYTEVNHLDENKQNNNASNLEWCTRKHNVNYGSRTEKQSRKISKPVVGYSSVGVVRFPSGIAAAKALSVKSSSCISACRKGKRKTAYGYRWRYAND